MSWPKRVTEEQTNKADAEQLRDTFAAAALTGLLSNIPRYQLGVIAVQAYDIADEMLRERLRNVAVKSRETVQSDRPSGVSSASAAAANQQLRERGYYGSSFPHTQGPRSTNHDADEMLRERLRNGAAESRETSQQLKDAEDFVRIREQFEAWQKEQSVSVAEMDSVADRKSVATPRACASSCSQPFDSAPTTSLTDAERWAITYAADLLIGSRQDVILRKLLERLK